MMWAYIAFTQFLIVWGEDLPRETDWYAPRMQTSWLWLGVAAGLLNFVLPVVAMLFRRVKRSPPLLACICLLVLAGQWLDMFWLVSPSLHRDGFALHWLDFAAFIAQGGLWLAAVATIAARIPSPREAPSRSQALAHG